MSRKTGRSRQPAQAARPERGKGRAARGAAPSRRATGQGLEALPAGRWLPFAGRIVFWAATAVFFLYCWLALERQITWYLAVDQFGYLTFARDLLQGHVFHEWPPLKGIGHLIPQHTDVLVQTYVRDGDRLYCRYSPGFPILIAGWIGLFGDEAAHSLNPLLYLALIAVSLAFQWRIFRSPWRAASGAALFALFPTMTHLWGLTLTRDVSAHVFAFLGLFLLLPAHGRRLGAGRAALAGFPLGFAICIRPDAVIYALPASGLCLLRMRRERLGWRGLGKAVSGGALGALVGVAPLLLYNWVAVGNPVLPTQGMELPLLPAPVIRQAPPQTATPPAGAEPDVAYPPGAWHGGTTRQVQGGGLRLSHLKTTMPAEFAIIQHAYSPLLLALALWGVVIAALLRPALLLTAVPYCVVAFLFFSCWPRPDTRYIIGVFVFLPMLIVEGLLGTLDAIRLAQRLGRQSLARGLAVAAAGALCAGVLLTPPASPGSALATLMILLPSIGAAGALAAGFTGRRVVAVAAPLLMLALVAVRVQRAEADSDKRAPFQRAQMLQARANMSRLLEPGAVVITSEEVGRPAENIEAYSGRAHALYLTDLRRWHLTVDAAAMALLGGRMRPYLYIPTEQPDKETMLKAMSRLGLVVERVAVIPAASSMLHFVAAPFHRGKEMELYRISSPPLENLLKQLGQPVGS